ncbi:MAG: MarR family transcriptional regulator [Thermomicrobiales bacterium]
MHDADRMAFVEDFGVTFEQSGSSRMAGRVLALLMVSDPPHLTATQLAETLNASRGSISQATRSLTDMGLIRRGRIPGTRQDLFSVLPSAWVDATRHSFQQITSIRRLLQRGLDSMDGRSPQSRAALEESVAFMAFWEEFLPQAFALWEQWKQEHQSDSTPASPVSDATDTPA